MSPGIYIQERDRGLKRLRGIIPAPIYIEEPPAPPEGPFYLYTMGDNTYHQLGVTNYSIVESPIEIPSLSNMNIVEMVTTEGSVPFSTYNSVTYFRTSDNNLWAWGKNLDGYLFQTASANVYTEPVQLSGSWKKIGAGAEDYGGTFLGLKTNNTLWGWGRNEFYLLAGGETYYDDPVQIGVETDWVTMDFYELTAVGLRASGSNTMWGWGNLFGSFGNPGGPIRLDLNDPARDYGTWVKVIASSNGIFGLQSNGNLWVKDTVGAFEQISGNWQDISSGENGYVLGLRSNGELYSWGTQIFPDAEDPYTPTRVGTDLWNSIPPHLHDTPVAIKSDGTLWGWGYGDGRYVNYFGAVGDGSRKPVSTPTQLSPDTDWVKVFDFPNRSFAIKADGSVYGWGYNHIDGTDQATPVYGSLAYLPTSSISASAVPIRVNDMKVWMTASNNRSNTAMFAIKNDGTLWSWGLNLVGELGHEDYKVKKEPTQVGTDTWKMVSAGELCTLGITTDGKLYSWGDNTYGQLGTGNYSSSILRTWIEQESTWKTVVVGPTHNLAIKSDGTLWSWGSGSIGELGLGVDSSLEPAPVQIGSDTDWEYVWAGFKVSFAIKSSGQLYGWGSNVNGQAVYTSTSASLNTPELLTDSLWKMVVTEDKTVAQDYHPFYSEGWQYYHRYLGGYGFPNLETKTYAIRSDNTLWAWGLTFGSVTNIPIYEPPYTDQGLSGAYDSTSLLSGGEFSPVPSSSIRLTTSLGTCVTSSIPHILLGSASLEEQDNAVGDPGNQDDGFYQIDLPFSISYNGNTYNYVFVSTNSYITFGDDINDPGYSIYDVDADTPATDKIFISGYDNYSYRVYYGQEGNTFRIRWEGNSEYDESGTSKIWEVVFYENIPNQIDIHIGDNGNWVGTITGYDTIVSGTQLSADSWKYVTADGGIKTNGTAWVRGRNRRGQLGLGYAGNFVSNLTQIGSDTDWYTITRGPRYQTFLPDLIYNDAPLGNMSSTVALKST